MSSVTVNLLEVMSYSRPQAEVLTWMRIFPQEDTDWNDIGRMAALSLPYPHWVNDIERMIIALALQPSSALLQSQGGACLPGLGALLSQADFMV